MKARGFGVYNAVHFLSKRQIKIDEGMIRI